MHGRRARRVAGLEVEEQQVPERRAEPRRPRARAVCQRESLALRLPARGRLFASTRSMPWVRAASSAAPVSSAVRSTTTGRVSAWPAMWAMASSADPAWPRAESASGRPFFLSAARAASRRRSRSS